MCSSICVLFVAAAGNQIPSDGRCNDEVPEGLTQKLLLHQPVLLPSGVVEVEGVGAGGFFRM